LVLHEIWWSYTGKFRDISMSIPTEDDFPIHASLLAHWIIGGYTMLHYAKYLLDGSEVQGWFLKFASAESTSLHSKLLDPPGFRVSLWGLGKLTQRIGSRENHPRSFHQFPQCTWNFPATVPWSQLRETSANAQKDKSLGKGTYPQEWRNTYIHTLHYNYNYIYILHLHLIFTLHYITYIHTDTHTHIYIYILYTHPPFSS
jgi:hypothetical protein